jgi:3-deoxy-D-manno-octulosonic-acid transferase
MRFVYSLAIFFYTSLIRLVSPFNNKANLWVKGRNGWKEDLQKRFAKGEKTIWIHCASLGEFEQGRPVIESIREKSPGSKILLTFFSPSGYEIRKEWPFADYICYLPADTPGNAESFVRTVNPEMVLFVKYEFWNNYITTLYQKRIPVYLISAIFRPGQIFFRRYGGFFRSILGKYSHIFVQDEASEKLLSAIGTSSVSVTGDTRFDRVVKIAGSAKTIPVIESFSCGEKVFMAGSSWKQDEEIIAEYINKYPGRMKWIFAPHEIDNPNIERLEKLLTVKSARFSEQRSDFNDVRVLIIDNIGMLSSAYRYAYIAAVGGGFGKGIHNVLEPACWGLPVMFGPNYQKFREAVELINEEGAVSFNSFESFRVSLDKFLNDEPFYLKSAKMASYYITKNTGATTKIISEIFKKDIDRNRV